MAQVDTLNDTYAGVKTDVSEVAVRVESALSGCFALLGDEAYGSDMVRGKLLRPALVLMCGKLYRDDVSELINLATASELIHVATLIHDDVVDGAEMRRGIPSVKAKWDAKLAVLCGDRIVCEGLSLLGDYKMIGATDVMLTALKGVIQGEIRQLRSRPDIDETRYIEVAREKTGSLMSAVCRLSAMWFRKDQTRVGALAQFGECFGIGFQIVDDLLDLTGEEAALGKMPLSDVQNGKRTLPLFYLREIVSGESAIRGRLNIILNAGTRANDENDIRWLSHLVRESGCAERTIRTATDHIVNAKRCLGVFPDSSAKESLLNLSDFVLERRF